MSLNKPPFCDQVVTETIPGGRKGRIKTPHATTATVSWDDGTESRIPYASLSTNPTPKKAPTPTATRKVKSIKRRFSQVVRERMTHKGLTFEELSDATGISRTQLLRLDEKDSDASRGFTAQTIERLCLALDVEPSTFWELKPVAR